MTQLIESLKKCRIEGNVLYLPSASDGILPNYNEVKKALLNAGASYKRNSFVFSSNAQSFVDRLTGGESVNIKKEFQFFGTPANVAKRMADKIMFFNGASVLEPSAGQGALVSVLPVSMNLSIDCVELMPENASILKQKGYNVICDDFLTATINKKYDIVLANPPFTKNQDIDHIRKMYDCCNRGGQIITLSSPSWTFGSQNKQVAFREWLEEIEADIEEVEAGVFKSSGTMIKTILISITK